MSGTAHAAASLSPSTTAPTAAQLLPLKWQVSTDGAGMYASKLPVINGILYYSHKNTLYAKNIATGKTQWSYKQGAHPEIVTANSIFFIDNQEQLVKLSAATGKLIWKVKVSEHPMEVGGQARLINGMIYFANESGGVAAYNPVTGKRLWVNKDIPMYAGSIYGEYPGALVVSSTVDNIRTQFFGLDPFTGKRLWRTEGLYNYVASEQGQLVLREQAAAVKGNTTEAVPGYQLTLVKLNPTTGKLSDKENYNLLKDTSNMGSYATTFQNSYIYSVDSILEQEDPVLTRLTRGADTVATVKSYASYGKWLSGPADGMAFFQHETQISGVKLADDSVVAFDHAAEPVEHLQRAGHAVFAIYRNGTISVNHSDTGALLGMIKSGATSPSFGRITIVNGTALIPMEHRIIAVPLPEEYQ
ncbi:PQQ-binding-like beta-propeller repeat protein [Paenibacillus tritici]|uniref:outer membrane protein assembly factor BamB family protein n=1 Tax=Paenibacillus tritici TaxID=1873425 RepID=UPI001BAB1D4C|nr:PQQ-binding-like beta-propeller repeat protein [Paenibacillus tritici]QUL52379.1 PQQ-binding-like beta-propeller repeat protein [Paenibacillus tritici]